LNAPFDAARLDRLMDAAGVDAVLACSPHNVSYLLGGYRFFMFAHGTVMGASRYLPIVGYVRGAPERAFFVGNPFERSQQEHEPLWVPDVDITSWTTGESGRVAARALAARAVKRVAIEPAFLPVDAHHELAGLELVDGSGLLDELRAVKRPDEVAQIRAAAEAIVESMGAVFAAATPGINQQEIAELMHVEEARRGLTFEYCLVNTGRERNRAPNAAVTWNEGELCCLDSGGSFRGYVGDLARMGFMGDVPERALGLLAQIDTVQQAARTAIAAGRPGAGLFAAAEAARTDLPDSARIDFVAHGMGLISHEAPRLTATGPVPYAADHADRSLEAGMVLSVETDLRDPEIGFVKLEDTIIVTEDGYEAVGDRLRGWNQAGTAPSASSTAANTSSGVPSPSTRRSRPSAA
jgi:Xaa-Pro aminopeptidase